MTRSSSDVRSVTVPPVPESVGVARRFVRQQLLDGGADDDTVDTATLLVSEIVTNAVLHAHTDVSVTVDVRGERDVRVEVTDASVRMPEPRRHDVESVTGRGLELVELMATDFGVQTVAGGKVVWFALGDELSPAAAGWGERDVVHEVSVVLRGVPVALYEVVIEHNEALLREYELHRLVSSGDDGGHSPEEVSAAARARLQIASVFQALVTAAHAAGPETPRHVDVPLRLPADDLSGFELLVPVLTGADTVAARGGLLTRPALPELRQLREWIFGEVVRQLQGSQPVPWVPESVEEREPLMPPADVDTRWVDETERGVVVGDDSNRIVAVSAAAARLLGWERVDLVGRRLTTIVPVALREAHVAGFTRQLVTGRETILGVDLELTALHRQGHEVPVVLRLERTAAGDRTLFLGWLEGRQVSS